MLIKYLKFLLSSKLLIDQYYILKKKKKIHTHTPSVRYLPLHSLTRAEMLQFLIFYIIVAIAHFHLTSYAF